MNFLLDENIAPSLGTLLIKRRYSAVHVKEVNLLWQTDEVIFNYAFEKNLIIITHDLDFSRIHAFSGKNKPSVILFRMESLTVKLMDDILTKNLPAIESDLLNGAFVVIEANQIRIRTLPIK